MWFHLLIPRSIPAGWHGKKSMSGSYPLLKEIAHFATTLSQTTSHRLVSNKYNPTPDRASQLQLLIPGLQTSLAARFSSSLAARLERARGCLAPLGRDVSLVARVSFGWMP